MPPAVIDACCLIDLLASGHAEAILRACGHAWHIPSAVQAEVKYVRQYDAPQPGQVILVAADLDPLLGAGVLTACQPDNEHELDRFIQYATQFRSDGEAMCLAIAECRGWPVATDDRKAIRIAQQAGLTVLSCPELVKTWDDAMHPDQSTLIRVLDDIELLAQFRPNPSLPQYQWWVDQLAS
jgi:hypothetical protein